MPTQIPCNCCGGEVSDGRCTECGVIFKFTGGDPLRPRCTSLDDEARELTGF